MKNIIILFFLNLSLFSNDKTEKLLLNYIPLPQKNWSFYMDVYSLALSYQKDVISANKKARQISLFKKINMDLLYLTIYIEPKPVDIIKNSRQCADYYFDKMKKVPITYINLYKNNYKDMYIIQRDVLLYPDDKTKLSRNVNVYLYFDDYCIDVHISKTLYRKGDARFFNKIINSLKILFPYVYSLYDYYNFGNSFFYNNNFKEAINFYEKTVEIEEKEKKLTREQYIATIDNLGMAYRIMKDYKAALLKFDFGLSKFSNYPTFYYNKATTYAEMDDVENSISNLKLAFKNKALLIKGEKIPDPRKDPSFAKILDDYKFLDFIKSLN